MFEHLRDEPRKTEVRHISAAENAQDTSVYVSKNAECVWYRLLFYLLFHQ